MCPACSILAMDHTNNSANRTKRTMAPFAMMSLADNQELRDNIARRTCTVWRLDTKFLLHSVGTRSASPIKGRCYYIRSSKYFLSIAAHYQIVHSQWLRRSIDRSIDPSIAVNVIVVSVACCLHCSQYTCSILTVVPWHSHSRIHRENVSTVGIESTKLQCKLWQESHNTKRTSMAVLCQSIPVSTHTCKWVNEELRI